jgi:signal transduction histidine kinase
MYGMPLSKGASILPETEEGKSTIKHWIAAYERALLGEAVYEILTDKAEDGREIVMDVRLYPIMDDSGMVICVGCFAHDITKRRQHEKHIERQNKQLMEIAWIQSHELRAPLANILGLVQLLRIDGENKSYYEMYLQKLQEASNELDRIIHEVVARSVIPFEQSDSHAPSA